MKKQIILSSLFFVAGLFLSPVQAANLEDLEICPNPNSSETPPVVESSKPLTVTNPMAPKEVNGNEALKVGYTCKVPTVEKRRGYKNEEDGDVYVQWTLVKKEGSRKIWAAHTLRWGPEHIYVGYVEDDFYTFNEAEKVCARNKDGTDRIEEIVFNGETRQIKMTLPEIGFGTGGSDINNPLNFQLLEHLNYMSVVYQDRNWLWSGSLDINYRAWLFHPDRVVYFDDYQYGLNLVRCVGLQARGE